MDTQEIRIIKSLSGFAPVPKAIDSAQEALREGRYVTGDALLEMQISDEIRALMSGVLENSNCDLPPLEQIPPRLRTEISMHIREEIFGMRDEKCNGEEKLRPVQARFINRARRTKENLGMAFFMAGGKTRTYLEVAREFIQQNPGSLVIISTPQNNLVDQIKREINRFSSLAPLKAEFANNGKIPDFNERERAAIQTESFSDTEYEAFMKKHFPGFGKKLIIATPQRLQAMLADGTLEPTKVGLCIIDEAGIGSSTQSGKFGSFEVVRYLREAHGKFRIICADATPVHFAYLKEQFCIEKWDYGEDPLFANVYHNKIEPVPDTPEHVEVCEEFDRIVRAAYRDFYNEIVHVRVKIPVQLSTPGDDKTPRVKALEYKEIKETLSATIKHEKNPDAKRNLGKCMSALVAYYQLQLLRDKLRTKTYSSVANTIRDYEAKFLRNPHARTLKRTLRIHPNAKTLKDSFLLKFASRLEQRIEHGQEHPKLTALRQLLEQIEKEGKQALILCEHLGVANWLNHYARTKWKLTSAVIHGQDSAPKKNTLRQKYVFEKFKKGTLRHIFATSVADRGLDIPEIDYVIAFSPAINLATRVQTMGRMRRGGTMFTLCSEDELPKAYNNEREFADFLKERKKYAINDEEEQLEVDIVRTKFSGKPKKSFFAGELAALKKLPLNKAVSERFYLEHVSPPAFEPKFKKYSMRLRLRDKTGIIDCYYVFSFAEEAQDAYDRLKKGGPMVVNGILRKAAKSGKVYLQCHHNSHLFQQGVIPCPCEDADMESLASNEAQTTPISKSWTATTRTTRKKVEQSLTEQLKFNL